MGRYALTVFIFLLHVHLALSQLPPEQVSTMSSVYQIFQNNTGSFVWSNVQLGSSPCSWSGVACNSDNSSILQLSFSSFQLSTSDFLPIICQIDTLRSLDVSNNMLASIPDRFFVACGNLSGLRLLNFSRNHLNGSLPIFNGFRTLEVLDFARNSLSGESITQLEGLDSLRSLNLSSNWFTGNIPTNLGRLGLLEELQLSYNHFTNGIPLEIMTYQNLRVIDLSANGLSGSIPEELGQLPRLETLDLSLNALSGEIPNSLSNVSTLIHLDLSYNTLTGTISSDLLSRPNLQYLDLSFNELQGAIPAMISTSLIRLRLGSNSLAGMLPAGSFQNLTRLRYLELDDNNLNGPIPSELGMCQSLALLNLAHNGFTGSLPPALGNLTNLQVLNLQANNLVGVIPPEITRLGSLEGLNLSQNSFSGLIPTSVSSLSRLANLDLQRNNLSGQIPNGISSLASLRELQLGNNQLRGPIPEMPSNLQIALNLSHNQFAGSIPVSLERLSALEVLDLSDNQFSGEIPAFLTRLASLTLLDLSDNQLSGVLPRFGSYMVVDTNGTLIVRASNPQRKRRSLASSLIIAFTTASAVVILIIIVAVFISRRYNRINDEILPSDEQSSPPRKSKGTRSFIAPFETDHLRLSYGDLQKSTGGFSESNLLGAGRFGSVYKGILKNPQTSVAIKVLNLNVSGAAKSLMSECNALRGMRHRSLVKILSVCSSIDFKGDDFKALVYEYMVNGDLDKCLHRSSDDETRTLSLKQRVNIAIDIASGLEYLHGGTDSTIVHGDLKPSNILLDEDMSAHVSDFGMAKVISDILSTDESRSLGLRGTIGYIPPEYGLSSIVSTEGDVYSYGILLLEMFTGKRPTNDEPNESPSLRDIVKSALRSQVMNVVDPVILQGHNYMVSDKTMNCIISVLEIGLACSNELPRDRMLMNDVVNALRKTVSMT